MTSYDAGPGADPALLRSAAAELRRRVDVWHDVAGRVDAAATSMVYVGPAGDRYRADTAAATARLRSACAGVSDLAERILREAHRVESERSARPYDVY